MDKRLKGIVFAFAMTNLWTSISASESYYVSPHGYFIGDSEHVTDWKLAKAIVDFLEKEKGQTIVDFGCGDGDYVNYFLKNNCCTDPELFSEK